MKCVLRWGAWLLVLLSLIPSVLGQTVNTTIYSDPFKDGWIHVSTFNPLNCSGDINALSNLRVGGVIGSSQFRKTAVLSLLMCRL